MPEVAGQCAALKFAACITGLANYSGSTILGIVAIAAILLIILAFFEGVREVVKDSGRAFMGWISTLLRRGSDPAHYYLHHFIDDFTDPKYQPFTGDEVKDKPTLEKVYLSLNLRPEALGDPEDRKTDDKAAGLERAVGRFSAGRVELAEAIRQSKKHLALIGGAGSGKSTLLHWAGLACAKDYARRRLDPPQREFVWALSKVGRSLRIFRIRRWLLLTRPLLPVFIPLGEFDQFCGNPRDPQQPEKKIEGPLPPNAETLLMFACWRFNRAHPEHRQTLTPSYLKRKLREGALVLCDGVDEVVFERREMVRRAVQGLLHEEYVSLHTRMLLTSRPPGYAREAWSDDFLKCEVLPMTPAERDTLIGNWFRAIYSNLDKAKAKTRELVQSLDDGDERVQEMARTPLLATIFAKLQHNNYRLPDQRARVYQEAVGLILDEVYRKGDAEAGGTPVGSDSGERLEWLSHIAFELQQAGVGEAGMIRNDLIGLVCREVDPAKRRVEEDRLQTFVDTIAKNACLLEETQENHYGFRSHRAFQEFLAGRYLVRGYPKSQLNAFIQAVAVSPNKDQWEEPLRLAAGFLAIDSRSEVEDFLGLLYSLRVELDSREHYAGDWNRAVAALALFDLPEARWKNPSQAQSEIIESGFDALARPASSVRDALLAELGLRLAHTHDPRLIQPLHNLLTASPPIIQGLQQRRAIGLALAALGDPRFTPVAATVSTGNGQAPGVMLPSLVTIPGGSFRMGTSDDEAKWLKEQFEVEAWDDEKPQREVFVSEFQIGRYPVTNAEFRAFVAADGYLPDQPWWEGQGRLWRRGELQPDFSFYTGETRKNYERWLEGRPLAKRNQPFYWDDPQWNAANLPVVGVTWYEAEAYCKWLSAVAGRPFRLPTEAEWEKAARGPQGTQWPWGNEWEAERCNSEESHLNATTPVGMYPHGAAVWPAGLVEDLVGNVWEWCGDWYDDKLYQQRATQDEIDRDPKGSSEGKARGLRGGAYLGGRRDCRSACRSGGAPVGFSNALGFRVVRSP